MLKFRESPIKPHGTESVQISKLLPFKMMKSRLSTSTHTGKAKLRPAFCLIYHLRVLLKIPLAALLQSNHW